MGFRRVCAILFSVAFCFCLPLYAADTFGVATYNIENYLDQPSGTRHQPGFLRIDFFRGRRGLLRYRRFDRLRLNGLTFGNAIGRCGGFDSQLRAIKTAHERSILLALLQFRGHTLV